MRLPAPRRTGRLSLEAALARRRSVEAFRDRPLTDGELSQLLWAAQGETDADAGLRTAPSAGGLYPLELYVATPAGLSRYVPQGHRLEAVRGDDVRGKIHRASLRQQCVRTAPALFLFCADHGRTRAKYGDDAKLYVPLEAGHAAQNLLLQAVALGLDAVAVGALYGQRLRKDLGLPARHRPLYLVAVGRS